MTRYLHHTVVKSPRQVHHQHDSAALLPAWLGSDIMQQLDHQRQRYMTSAASRHTASSYWYYSPLYLVSGPMQASRCATWHLREASTFWRFTFEDFKLYTAELNSLKDLIWESRGGATPNRCTYTVPYSINSVKKHSAISCQSTWFMNFSTQQTRCSQGRFRSPNTYSLAKHSGAADEDWHPRYHPAWTRKAQGGFRYDSAHNLEDSRWPWHALKGLDSYIHKIGK
jgi:hypothetical protein